MTEASRRYEAAMDIYMNLALATASALAINGLKVNKALKLLVVTGAVFAIGWNAGEASGVSGGASRDISSPSIDPSAFLHELKRSVARTTPSIASADDKDAQADGMSSGREPVSDEEDDPEEAEEI